MSAYRSARSSQRGVALAVVLILLVVMMLLGLAAMRGTLMQERMSANQFDRSMAFQAAEAALREGESVATGRPTPAGPGCANGICTAPAATDTPRWLDTDANWNANSKAVTTFNAASSGALGITPRYIVELMATDVPAASCTTSGDLSPDAECHESESRYRITARSQAAGRADVILQSNFAAP